MQREQQKQAISKLPGATKRHLWWIGALMLVLFPLSGVLLSAQILSSMALAGKSPVANDLAQYVNPFIGSVAAPQYLGLGSGFDSGNVFPGALAPRGMVQWSPDTTTAAGGYRYNQLLVHGFSLTHFSGRGCAAYQDFPFMPFVGSLSAEPFRFSDYAALFSHDQESASPGYYSVTLPAQQIQVELTTTLRTGFGRFTYPASSQSLMLVNAGGSATGDAQNGTNIQINNQHEISGQASSGHFCSVYNTYTVYFVAEFDRPFTAQGTWQGTHLQASSRQSSGSQAGAYLQFDTRSNQVVRVRVGLSFVSVENARLNLQRESPDWNFSRVHAQARAAWDQKLGLVQVQGGSLAEKQTFYTALYHTFMHPNVFSDVNGQYIGFDKRIHQAQGYTQYENFPGWDMYRSLVPLMALLEPRSVGEMLQSLVADAQQGGGALPRWEVANDNSGGMVGDSMDVVISTSYALGVRNFDAQAALRAMILGAADTHARSGLPLAREGLAEYLHKGYVSTDMAGSASITLEYAVDDYALARFAAVLGDQTTAQRYLKHARKWQNLFDAKKRYIVPRNPDGSFLSGFTPQSSNGFVESSGATYLWMVPQDLPGLLTRLGGNAPAVARLDQLFQQLNSGTSGSYAFMGNEPGFGVPWVYAFAGQPERAQEVVRRIQEQLFNATPAGLPGNDDGGAMSSWYIFSALGLYPEIPGVAGFVLGSPLFSSAQLRLGNGSILTIAGQGAADASPYVQGLSLNAQPWHNPWLPWSAIQHGGTLAFALGAQTNVNWYEPIQVV